MSGDSRRMIQWWAGAQEDSKKNYIGQSFGKKIQIKYTEPSGLNDFEYSSELNWMNFKNQNEWNLRLELNEISWDPEWMKFEIGNEWNSRLKSDNK